MCRWVDADEEPGLKGLRSRTTMSKSNHVANPSASRRTPGMNCLLIALATALTLFQTAHAHDSWDNGEQVPVWVKTVCCGPNDVHHLRPEQVRRNAACKYHGVFIAKCRRKALY